MAAVALTGASASAAGGRASLLRAAVLRGHGDAASAGRAYLHDGPFPALDTALYALTDLTTPIASLSLTREWSWTETLNDVGSFEITFQNDDPALALVESSTTLITFFIDGVPTFSGIPENREATLVSPNDEAGQVTKWSGRGHASLLDRAIQYPALQLGSHPVEEDRQYNWQAGTYDWVGNGAVAATVIDSVTNAQAGSLGRAWDADFADPGCDILGPSSGTTSASPVGNSYYEQTVTITTLGAYELQVLMKDYGEVYFDGALVTSPGQASDPPGTSTELKMTRTNLDLSPGLHSISAQVYSMGGGTGWAFAVAAANDDGTVGAIAGSSSVASGALVIAYPSAPPGETPGQALIDFQTECQTGTVLGGGRATGDPLSSINQFTRSFTGTHDTAGTAWPSSPEISTKIGSSMTTFLKELSATYIDWYVAPGTKVLDAWVIGGRGIASGVDFHSPTDENDPSTGNLMEHVETAEG